MSGAFSVEANRLQLFGSMDWNLIYASSLAAMLQTVAEETSEDELYRIGYEATHVGGAEFAEKIGVTDYGWDQLSKVVEMLDFLGYGAITFTETKKDESPPRIAFRSTNNPTVEQAIDLYDSDAKVCGFFCGVYAAHLEMELGLDTLNLEEHKCLRDGKSYCSYRTVIK